MPYLRNATNSSIPFLDPGNSNATNSSIPQPNFGNSSATNSSIPHHETRYSPASVAGISIGTAIAGALLSLLIGYIFLKRRRGPRQARRSDDSLHLPLAQVSPSTTPKTLTAALDRLDHDLPQESTHTELLKEAAQLEITLANYVDNFIDSNGTPTSPLVNDDELSRLAGGVQRSWNERLLNQGTRSVTLRIFLAHFLVARTNTRGDAASTLLPPEILKTYQATTNGETPIRK